MLVQNHYNAVYREDEREVIPYSSGKNIAYTPFSPLVSKKITHSDIRSLAIVNNLFKAAEDAMGFQAISTASGKPHIFQWWNVFRPKLPYMVVALSIMPKLDNRSGKSAYFLNHHFV